MTSENSPCVGGRGWLETIPGTPRTFLRSCREMHYENKVSCPHGRGRHQSSIKAEERAELWALMHALEGNDLYIASTGSLMKSMLLSLDCL